jgi:hypothetical protein
MNDFGKASYPPVGRCIYCGRTEDLRDEHIIPYALGGKVVLPKASCENCATITGKFEQQVLRGHMWLVRVLRKLPSRRKHRDAPKTKALTFVRAGKEQVNEFPLEESPIFLHFPIFRLPAFLYPEGYTSGIRLVNPDVVTIRFGSSPENVLERLDASSITQTDRIHPTSFARMIAKIAYSAAYAEGYLNSLDGAPMLLPALLGERDEIGLWVGTLNKPPEADERVSPHRVICYEDGVLRLLLAEVQLFTESPTPTYGVILGRLKPEERADTCPGPL